MPEHIRPLRGFVVIARDPDEENTEGGLVIPDAHRARATRGTVLAVGPGKHRRVRRIEMPERITPDVRPGDRVLFPVRANRDFDGEGHASPFLRHDLQEVDSGRRLVVCDVDELLAVEKEGD